MPESNHSSAVLYPYQHYTALLTALGNFIDGGRVAVIEDARSIDIEFDVPPLEFTVLTVLLQRSLETSDEDEMRVEFVSKTRLLQELKRQFQIDDPQTVVRTVFRLRERLKNAVLKKLDESEAHAWSRSFLEHSRFGYRVSVPRVNLRLAILDEEPYATA